MTDVKKVALTVPISQSTFDDGRGLMDALNEFWRATPAERRAIAKQNKIARAALREASALVPLSLDALVAHMGWSTEYAEHLCQPYCDCCAGQDGWEYCHHAYDLGLV